MSYKIKDKFFCTKCGSKLKLWEIFKLSLGSNTTKKTICRCGNEIKFKENQILRYLPALAAGAIVFFIGNKLGYIIYSLIVIFSFIIYFASFKRSE